VPRARADALLRAANEYYNAGFLPLPLQGGENAKRPLSRCVAVANGFETGELDRLYESGWGEFPFGWERFEELFKLAGGIGIACGKCSGGLAVIDFDDPAAHKIWIREHAEVAARMPAVKTARGIHYYFVPAKRLQGAWKVFRVAGFAGKAGELKFERTYVAAPPSKHPSGVRYKWQGPSILERRPPVIELAELRLTVVGLVAGLVEADQDSDQADQSEQLEQTITGSLTLSGGVELNADLSCWQRAVCFLRRHLPKKPARRNAGLLGLVRSLKKMPELSLRPASHFSKLIAIWCEEIEKLPFVRGITFEENWREFQCAWDGWSVASATGFAGLLKDLELGRHSQRDKTRLICYRLSQLSEGQPFYLGTIALANHLHVSQSQAKRILKGLAMNEEIVLVKSGRRSNMTANEYQIGPQFQLPF
jgi:hypothetical protein